jgi:2-keto-3-deoxy-L-rhamnonate aldolase RhmA
MNRIIRLLEAGQPVFGIFSGDKTAAQGGLMIQNEEIDFVFYSLESGPFDIPTMQGYMQAMLDGAGDDEVHPIALRIPPIRDGHGPARQRTQQGLTAGADAIVFPHVETAEEATLAVSFMGTDSWPANPDGEHVNMVIIEDQVGIQNAREIVSTPGVGIAIPGPGDLRRAYDGDMEAVESAIQTVLAACKEFDVACGITAGVEDIADRLEQGFRVFIVSEPEVLSVGRGAAGRVP